MIGESVTGKRKVRAVMLNASVHVPSASPSLKPKGRHGIIAVKCQAIGASSSASSLRKKRHGTVAVKGHSSNALSSASKFAGSRRCTVVLTDHINRARPQRSRLRKEEAITAVPSGQTLDASPSAPQFKSRRTINRVSSSTSEALSAVLLGILNEYRLRDDYVRAQGNLSRQINRFVGRVTGEKTVDEKAIKAFYKTADPHIRLHMDGMSNLLDIAQKTREAYEKPLCKMVSQLPIWKEFGAKTCGFGEIGMCAIICEAGGVELFPAYANHSKLWKRFGLHVANDGLAFSTFRAKKLTKEEWTTAGYAPKRRAVMFWIVDSMLRQGTKTPYFSIYHARKAREMQKAKEEGLEVAPGQKIAAVEASERTHYRSLKHIDMRARRYVAKQLLKDLWRAWRDLSPA